MCDHYIKDRKWEFVITKFISLWIVGFNKLLEEVIWRLTVWVGHETNSQQKVFMTRTVFLAKFLNTAVILLLINANLMEHSPISLTRYTK